MPRPGIGGAITFLNEAKRLSRYRATTGDGYRYGLFLPRSCIDTLYVSRIVGAAIGEMSTVALVKRAIAIQPPDFVRNAALVDRAR